MNENILKQLPPPAIYFPLERAIYEVAPNLKPFGTEFGNGERDKKLFQLDTEFPRFRANKMECRSERLSKYFCTHNLSVEVETSACRFMSLRLVEDWPELFELKSQEGYLVLKCQLTNEELRFDRNWQWVGVQNSSVNPPYVSGLDALCCQIQEDIALTSRVPGKEGWLSALHLSSPSHWAPEEKIGRDFVSVHNPVAGIERVNRSAPQLVEASIKKGPFVRFAWGFGTDNRLNHHPEPPIGADPKVWKGRSFEKESKSPFILRFERQVVYGLPEAEASFFSIHLYFIDGNLIRANEKQRELLRSALLSMTPESLEYKGLTHSLKDVIEWFDQKI